MLCPVHIIVEISVYLPVTACLTSDVMGFRIFASVDRLEQMTGHCGGAGDELCPHLNPSTPPTCTENKCNLCEDTYNRDINENIFKKNLSLKQSLNAPQVSCVNVLPQVVKS